MDRSCWKRVCIRLDGHQGRRRFLKAAIHAITFNPSCHAPVDILLDHDPRPERRRISATPRTPGKSMSTPGRILESGIRIDPRAVNGSVVRSAHRFRPKAAWSSNALASSEVQDGRPLRRSTPMQYARPRPVPARSADLQFRACVRTTRRSTWPASCLATMSGRWGGSLRASELAGGPSA